MICKINNKNRKRYIMSKKQKKGISLIVLVITIIVIIILAGSVILSLSSNNPITSSTEATFKTTLDAYKSELTMTLSNKYVTDFTFNPDTLSTPSWDGIGVTTGTVKQYVTSMTAADGPKYIIQKGKLVYIGTDSNVMTWAQNSGVEDSKISDYVVSEGVNKPKLTTGMTAKKWNATTLVWDTVATPDTDTTWYDYTAKQWANAQTADGSMWVWIPRYVYNISTGWHTSVAGTINIQFSKGINDSWNGSIDSGVSASASNFTTNGGKFTNHPAFTLGSTELTGIWVAKFEASGTTAAVDVKPNVTSLRSITIDAMFTACRNMETNTRYGWTAAGTGIDTHLMKNTEWGAVAYLTQSIYGKNSEVWINPNSSYITGQAGTTVSSSATTVTYAYNDLTYGINASTTGNISGIYDMSGGAWEYTAGYVTNGNANLTTYGLGLVNAASQYKDLYILSGDTRSGNYIATSGQKGDAVYETSTSGTGATAWFGDSSYMPYTSGPFFVRGGHCDGTTDASAFYFASNFGCAYSNHGFRPVVSVAGSL
jgi:Tfp pilus assembly protein PilE